MFHPYRNLSIDFQIKLTDWFLYKWETGQSKTILRCTPQNLIWNIYENFLRKGKKIMLKL